MSEPERIFLQPDEYEGDEESAHEGRTWATDDISGKDTEYVRVDLFEALRAELAAAKAEITWLFAPGSFVSELAAGLVDARVHLYVKSPKAVSLLNRIDGLIAWSDEKRREHREQEAPDTSTPLLDKPLGDQTPYAGDQNFIKKDSSDSQ